MKRDFFRLQRFADHLLSDRLTRDYSSIDKLTLGHNKAMIFYENLYYMILPWFELELPAVFPDFSINKRGIAQYHPNPKISVPFILPSFFGLNTQEYLHCFVVGMACSDFGSIVLKHESRPNDCGQILHEFVDNTISREAIEDSIQHRRVLIEKTSNLRYTRLLNIEPENSTEL